MSGTYLIFAVVATVMFAWVDECLGQTVGYVGGRPDWRSRRWSVGAYLGGSRGGANSDLEMALISSGWDEPRPDPVTGLVSEHPRSSHGGASPMIALRYRFTLLLAGELLFSNVETGRTTGYQFPTTLQLRHSVLSFAPLASVQLAILHLGAGPALHVVRAGYGSEGYDESHLKLGVLGDLGIAFPQDYVVFLDVRAQYRVVGKAEIGPISGAGGGSGAFPAAQIDFNHLYLSAGLAVRF
ncbi:MAG: hypothetical protein JSU87_03070 [Gemmatimonadota bacterium]|nr:MAG: hypothetical protein JSU87_03070 [Gemmatimonadota bacterium]